MKKIIFILLGTVFILSSCSKTTLSFLVDEPEQTNVPANYSFEIEETNCESFEWDFGDGTTSQDSTPNHTYYLSGNYMVTLKGRSGKKLKEVKKEIFVKAPEKCLIKIETTYGIMIAELYDITPKHRDNFIKLAEEGFYDDLLFHRVIKGFMIQGGDPDSRGADQTVRLGSGGPGYQVDAEITDKLAHTKGALAAARTGGPSNPLKKSSGSQFYIVQGKEVQKESLMQYEARLGINYPEEVKDMYVKEGGVPFLDQDYTVFGQVIEGLEVIDAIAAVKTLPGDRPSDNVSMKITVIK